MAEVFDPVNPNSGVGVGAPMLVGKFYPAIDKRPSNYLGQVTPWGGGSTASQLLAPVGGAGGTGDAVSTDDKLAIAIALLAAPRGDIINYSFEGLIGPMGPPGPPGPPGIPILPSAVPPVGYDIPQRIIDDGQTPAIPTGLSASALVNAVLLEWTDNTEPDINHYEVWRHTSDDSGSASEIAKVRTNFFIDGNLTAGVPQYYWLKAVDHLGNTSDFTASVTATPLSVGSGLTADIPLTNGIEFSDAGGGAVAWTGGTLSYQGTDYTITADPTGVTSKWIYWDKDVTPTEFQDTDTLSEAVGDADVWVMCYNDGGTPYPPYGQKIVHGGLIEASTIDTQHLAADAVEAANINVVGLNGTTGRIVVADATDADVITGGVNSHATTLIAPGKILISGGTSLDGWADGTEINGAVIKAGSITLTSAASDFALSSIGGDLDDVDDGTSYIKAPAAWKYTGQTTINGGQIQTDTILAASISTYNLTSTNATLENLIVKTAHIDNLNVTTGKIADDATTMYESAYTAAETDYMDYSYTEIQQIENFDSNGEVILLSGTATITNYDSGFDFLAGLALFRGEISTGVLLNGGPTVVCSKGGGEGECHVFAVDTPGDTSVTYTLAATPGVLTKMKAKERTLNLQEGTGK